MIGIFKPVIKKLPLETQKIYKFVYCSLCLSLKKKHGFLYALFISHEITQLVLSCLRYCEINPQCNKCAICFNRSPKDVFNHQVLDKAADLCLLLVWFKIVDAKVDREKIAYRMLYYLVKSKFDRIINNLEEPLKEESNKYIVYIKNENNYEDIINQTGIVAQLMYSVILKKTDIHDDLIDKLSVLGKYYGEIIAIADPVIDFSDDLKKGKKNPFTYKTIDSNKDRLKKLIYEAELLTTKLCNEGLLNNYFKTSFILAKININHKIHNHSCKKGKPFSIKYRWNNTKNVIFQYVRHKFFKNKYSILEKNNH